MRTTTAGMYGCYYARVSACLFVCWCVSVFVFMCSMICAAVCNYSPRFSPVCLAVRVARFCVKCSIDLSLSSGVCVSVRVRARFCNRESFTLIHVAAAAAEAAAHCK